MDRRGEFASARDQLCWLAIDDVSMSYRSKRSDAAVPALHDISICIAEGEFVSVVGPSGCGKTTLLKLVNGLLRPTAGSIELEGRPMTTDSRDRAMVFQDASLFPWYSVIRNVGYGLECQGISRQEAATRAQPFVDLVGLTGFEQHYPHELSGGMQQRANLARALAVDPAVLLMDEPFAALDAQTREAMQAELLSVWQKARKTVLFITHQIDEAVYLSDRVIVLSARPGRVLEDIRIDLQRPRALDVKRSPEFQAYNDRVWRLIQNRPPGVETSSLDDDAGVPTLTASG